MVLDVLLDLIEPRIPVGIGILAVSGLAGGGDV